MNEDVFLSALHESPTDEVTWLALADWLDEDGQTQRAELVRLVRRLRTLSVMRRTKPRATLEDRVASLLNAGVRPVAPEITNTIGMRLALIPPGTFRMGSPSGEPDRGYNETAHEVTLTRPFYLGVFPVTQRQYREVMGDNPSHFSRKRLGQVHVRDFSDKKLDTFPVDSVNFDEALAFLQRLQAREEGRFGQVRYRLPTEAEWEYVCRGGSASSTAFHFGSTLSSTQANFNGAFPYEAEPGPSLERPSPVGSYRPNVFGLYDVHGNVFEWCSDWFDKYPAGSVTDPCGPAEGMGRVIRGGSWSAHGFGCRAAYRYGMLSSRRGPYLGFRVALGE